MSGTLEKDPDRLRTPQIRDRATGEWRSVDWPEALAAVEKGLAPILVEGDRNAVGMYFGVAPGQIARVKSKVGELEAAVEITDALMPGVVSLPHGWGHGSNRIQMGVARERAGVNSNILTDSSLVDPLSGNAVLNGIPVEVSLAT